MRMDFRTLGCAVACLCALAAAAEEKETGAASENHPVQKSAGYRRMPFIGPEPGAPRTASRPSAIPTIEAPRHKVSESLDGETPFFPEETFVQPDWTQPLRDIEFDHMTSPIGGGKELALEGNVRLKLDTLSFAADRFWNNEALGVMHAQGNVQITQGAAYLTADDIYYQIPDEADMPKALILEPHTSEQQRAKLRLSFGSVSGKNIHIVDPSADITAGRLEYDVKSSKGQIEEAQGRIGLYHFGAARLRIIGPADVDGEDIWVTTCDHDPPHYKVRLKNAMIRDGKAVYGESARLYINEARMPLYWPRYGYIPGERGTLLNFDLSGGHRAGIGYYLNTGQQFALSHDAGIGLRLFPTTRAGVGFGIDSSYDFMKNPASPFYLSKGRLNSLYTTEGQGYVEWRHRQEIFDDTIMLAQVEQWSDSRFYKDFFYEKYRNRTQPRTFVDVTRTKPGYVLSTTVRTDSHGFLQETEQLPDLSYHLLQRPLAERLYVSLDSVTGFYNLDYWTSVLDKSKERHTGRQITVGRATYDLDLHEAFSINPFAEVDSTVYAGRNGGEESDYRLGGTFGATAQGRLHRAYSGFGGFSGFKHVVVPSVTYFYRPDPSMNVIETPRFDAYDAAYGRSRIEAKLDNVVFGRNERTGDVWQVARLTLYGGEDFSNEIARSRDLEMEMDIRPRPAWGWVAFAEHHDINQDSIQEGSEFARMAMLQLRDPLNPLGLDSDALFRYDMLYGNYGRALTYLYYGERSLEGRMNARIGFAYTETGDTLYNREVLYGLGCRLGDHWGVAFEHRYDFAREKMTQQKYELRRNLHCWEAALVFRDRETGWDIGMEFNIVAFPGTRVKF